MSATLRHLILRRVDVRTAFDDDALGARMDSPGWNGHCCFTSASYLFRIAERRSVCSWQARPFRHMSLSRVNKAAVYTCMAIAPAAFRAQDTASQGTIWLSPPSRWLRGAQVTARGMRVMSHPRCRSRNVGHGDARRARLRGTPQADPRRLLQEPTKRQSIRRIRFVAPDVAIVDVDNEIRGVSTMPAGIAAPADGVIRTQLLEVLSRRRRRWWTEAYRNVDVMTVTRP